MIKTQPEKTVEVKLRFWTNIDKDTKMPVGFCWDSGCAIVIKNPELGAKSAAEVFTCWDDIQRAVAGAMGKSGLRVCKNLKKEARKK